MKNKNPRLQSGFGFVTRPAMADASLSLREKGMYGYLATYADSATNELTVSVNRIAAECGVTQATVKRSLKILEEKQFIRRIYTGPLKTKTTVLLK